MSLRGQGASFSGCSLSDDMVMENNGITKLQGAIAVASFVSGVGSIFFVPPPGEIASSAVSIVSELLILCGAILGVKASYDTKFRKFQDELNQKADKPD